MRNPKRIIGVMSLLQILWEKHPDLRFNQLMHNLQHEFAKENDRLKVVWEKDEYRGIVSYQKYEIADLFYIEDDKFESFLHKKIAETYR